jgi:hypothetical protein
LAEYEILGRERQKLTGARPVNQATVNIVLEGSLDANNSPDLFETEKRAFHECYRSVCSLPLPSSLV